MPGACQAAGPAKPADPADVIAALDYDNSDNTWSTKDENLKPLANLMKRECGKSKEIKGTYLFGTDDSIIFLGGKDFPG